MARLEIKHEMGQGDIAAVSELLAVAEEVDGRAALGSRSRVARSRVMR